MKWIICILAGAVVLSTVTASRAQNDSLSAAIEPETEEASAPVATTDNIRRALFATDVVDREPVDEIDSLSTEAEELCFFTEIVGFAGGSITHRWTYEGETVAEVTFEIGGPRWRVYSRKTLGPELTGAWSVEIVDGSGHTVDRASISRSESAPPRSAQAEEATQGWDQ